MNQGGVRAVFENIKPAYQRAANEETAINKLINQNSSQANGAFDANKHHQETLGVDAKEIQKHIQIMSKNEAETNKENLDYARNLEIEKQNIVPDQREKSTMKPQLTK